MRIFPNSEVQKAIQYARTQWEALTVFLTDPAISLGNNLIENQMRPIALSRFAHLAGERDIIPPLKANFLMFWSVFLNRLRNPAEGV